MTDPLFTLHDQVGLITGAGGVLMGALACELARRGVRVIAVGRTASRVEATADSIRNAGGHALAVAADVTDPNGVQRAMDAAVAAYGRIDFLINGAGGNQTDATTHETRSFFDLPPEALRAVVDLNLMGSLLPSQAAGRIFAAQGEGVIVNISSLSALRPLTRIVGYSAAKAALNNFTQWLAVEMAQKHSPRIRVNALAPGFFLTEQNRFLLTKPEDQSLTERGERIIDHTPMRRFGTPEDLFGAAIWLLSPAAKFVTGTVIAVDGGCSAYAGV